MKVYLLSTLWAVMLSVALTQAQDLKSDFTAVMQNDSTEFHRLWLYPEEIRGDILDVSTAPGLILRLSSRQSRTQRAFGELISKYPRETQKQIWDLTRYPELINSLVTESDFNLDEKLVDYPKDIREAAKYLTLRQRFVLQEINELTETSNLEVEKLLQVHSEPVAAATRNLINYPETISILSSFMDETVIVGDAYKSDPEWVKAQIDARNVELVRLQKKDWREWREQIEDDPRAQKELEKAARDFSDETGITGLDYDPSDYEEEAPVEKHVHIYHHPYSYWFGYPYWYSAPLWYPAPLWYYTGWYYGPRGFSVIGMPHYVYFNWYYTWGYRRYPRIIRYVPESHRREYVTGPRRSRSGRGGYIYRPPTRERSYWNYRDRSSTIYKPGSTVKSRSRKSTSTSPSRNTTKTRSRKRNN